jgi:hypothetical protein
MVTTKLATALLDPCNQHVLEIRVSSAIRENGGFYESGG